MRMNNYIHLHLEYFLLQVCGKNNRIGGQHWKECRIKHCTKKSGVGRSLTFLENNTSHKQEGSQLFSHCASAAHPPTRKWPLIIELFLTLSITNDTLSTIMNTFCWRPIWLTGQRWSWPFGAPSTTCWFSPPEWTHRQTEDRAHLLVSTLLCWR